VTLALAIGVAGAIALPHVLPLHRSRPCVAAAAWVAVLVLRAVTATSLAVFAFVVLPRTDWFEMIAHRCWHAIIPLLQAHLGFSGHDVGEAAVLLPTFVLAGSLVSALWALRRAARAVSRLIRRDALEGGPDGSLIVGGDPVVVAAAGLRRPRVVVSAGALMALDDAELAASLEHERGHIERRHRFVLLVAQLCRALARFLPGTRAAVAELAFHLERDADEYALRRRHHPAALAAAICKAAGTSEPTATFAGLGGSHVTERVAALIAQPRAGRRGAARANAVMAASTAAVALALALVVPAAAFASASGAAAAPQSERHCAD
jgi:Zn-dependent protease with chaperone function